MPNQKIVIYPRLLNWVITESGMTPEEIASGIGITPNELTAWRESGCNVTSAELKRIARLFQRQPLLFLTKIPPMTRKPEIHLRRPPNISKQQLDTQELLSVRKALRMQNALIWLNEEIKEKDVVLPTISWKETNPREAAKEIRDFVGLTNDRRKSWSSHSAALHDFRHLLEMAGVYVFSMPIGNEHVNGFSVWNSKAPVIVLNSFWNEASRIFTVFHEFAHLLTRTNSACLQGGPVLSRRSDPLERWCEEFSAEMLLPEDQVFLYMEKFLKISTKENVEDFEPIRRIANYFKVSLTATTLWLINHGLATWELFRELPRTSDQKDDKSFNPNAEPRTRGIIFQQQFGHLTQQTFGIALNKKIINYSDAASYTDAPFNIISQWQKL